jgi:hypothetical protein
MAMNMGKGRSDDDWNQAQDGGRRFLLHVQDLDLALSALNIDANIVGVTPENEINRGLSDLEIFDANLLQKRRQKRIGKANLWGMAAHRQPQAGLEKQKNSCGGP